MKKIFFIFLFFLCVTITHAQTPTFNWAMQAGDSMPDIGHVIAKDASGNIYIAGNFQRTVDLDPGPGVFELSSYANIDIFVLKLSPAGNFIWAKQFRNEDYLCSSRPNGIVVNSSGEIYITGFFQGSVDFDPGPGLFLLVETTYTAPNAFVTKLDTDGNLIWAEKFDAESGTAITLDNNQRPVITGIFENTADFDPGPGYYPLTETHGLFIMRLKPNGAFSWARAIESNFSFGDNVTYSVANDADNSVYFTGSFSGVIDADPGPGVFNLSAVSSGLWGQNSFVMKLDSTGDFQWVKQIASGGDNHALCMAIRSDGKICIGGSFNGTADFDPGPATFTLSTTGNYHYDGFIMELDAAGNFVWAKQLQSTGTNGGSGLTAMVLDANNNMYASGYFSGTSVDFDPGPGTHILGTGGYDNDGFILRLTDMGELYWVGTISDHVTAPWVAADQRCNDLIIDNNGSIFFTGQFVARPYTQSTIGTTDFDPCGNNFDMTPVYQEDIFIARWDQYDPATAAVNITSDLTTICNGSTVIFTASSLNVGSNPTYQWQVNGINTGTNSNTYISNALANGDQIRVIITTNGSCAPVAVFTSNTIVANVSAAITPAINITASSATVCQGASVSFNALAVNPGNNPVYQWKKNGAAVGTNSSTYTDNSLNNGDVLQCMLTSDAACITTATATSNSITMAVSPVAVATLSIVASATGICAGEPVTFTANTSNAGNNAQYQWKKNGINAGTNTPSYTDNNLSDGDHVSCDLVPGGDCVTPATLSASVTMIVHPLPNISVTASATSIDEGSTSILTANASQSNQFAWYYNGTLVPGSTNNIITVDHNHLGEYFAVVTDTYGCIKSSNIIVIADSIVHAGFITPNPNHGTFIIRYRNDENNNTRYISIWDSKGAKVYRGIFVVSPGDGAIKLDLNYLSAGTYFIQLSDKNKKRLKTGKVIIK